MAKLARKPVVLLVEDNEDDIFLMRRLVKKAALDVDLQVATDGQRAVDYLDGTGEYGDRAKCPLPDFVFLDLKLPFLHGFEVLKWIRSQPRFENLPVTILTSSNEDRDREQAAHYGAPYKIKPPTPDMLDPIAGQI